MSGWPVGASCEILGTRRNSSTNKSHRLESGGWASAWEPNGPAVPSPENQAHYSREVTPLFNREQIKHFWFAAWNENWKTDELNGVGPHWGMFRNDEAAKPQIVNLLPDAARKKICRSSRKTKY